MTEIKYNEYLERILNGEKPTDNLSKWKQAPRSEYFKTHDPDTSNKSPEDVIKECNDAIEEQAEQLSKEKVKAENKEI